MLNQSQKTNLRLKMTWYIQTSLKSNKGPATKNASFVAKENVGKAAMTKASVVLHRQRICARKIPSTGPQTGCCPNPASNTRGSDVFNTAAKAAPMTRNVRTPIKSSETA